LRTGPHNALVAAPSVDAEFAVLYIEDNALSVHLVRRLFRNRDGVVLLTASCGREGLEIARREMPGLILLDVHLPDMSGVDVVNGLRGEQRTAAIPVVAVSADKSRDRITRLRASGVVDYVTKPFDVAQLLALVDSFARPGRPTVSRLGLPPDDHDSILDAGRVAELLRLDHDGAAFRSLAATALEDVADQIAAISAAPLAGQSAAAVSVAASRLGASAASVGARRLTSLADAIERTARAGSLPEPPMLSALWRTLSVTRQAMADAVAGR
jgi:CheY-like chemotaxis protein